MELFSIENCMRLLNTPVPDLTTAHAGELYPIERKFLEQVATIEGWFRQQWQKTPPPLTSSVDLRHAGFKLSPVDTNLFPAGFNNLNHDFLPLCVQAVQSVISEQFPSAVKVLIIPENHTRNRFYLQSLNMLRDILLKAGFEVRIGSVEPNLIENHKFELTEGSHLLIEPLHRHGQRVSLKDFEPCLVLLNNDLSTGIPDILKGIEQPISPPPRLGWASRLKSQHFRFFDEVATEFATVVDFDPWLINPYFSAVEQIDFMSQEGLNPLAEKTDQLLAAIRKKYQHYDISHTPFVAVKADNGTYGMSVMMVHSGEELLNLNRKQRTKMAVSKGSQKVTRVLIQEGVYTFESVDNAVAEPVVYMIGRFVVGGFYRVHQDRGESDNLNARGMHFKPLAFTNPCNMPCEKDFGKVETLNRFYAYGVIARLAALAAAREIKRVEGK